MKKNLNCLLLQLLLIGVTGVANANCSMLAQDDFVGISFWIISMGMFGFYSIFLLGEKFC